MYFIIYFGTAYISLSARHFTATLVPPKFALDSSLQRQTQSQGDTCADMNRVQCQIDHFIMCLEAITALITLNIDLLILPHCDMQRSALNGRTCLT